jgi:signal transduction histidine kinase
LINNALYAVGEKKKLHKDGYTPTVKVATIRKGSELVICVEDNGGGIPDTIKEKIFQPFFTTKPTGQGTGLGLSLSYDIIKAHGGTLSVHSTVNSGTTFQITLPITNA